MGKAITRPVRTAIALAAALMLALLVLAGCSSTGGSSTKSVESHSTDISASLAYDHSMDLDYATGFAIDYYDGGYKLVTIEGEGSFLVVPEGALVPEDLPEGIVAIQQPFDRIYLVASASMDMFRSIDAIGSIRMSGTKQDDWYIPEAAQAMAEGRILYAGKYNMPDYETIISEGCDLAIESTMIYHNPEVKEALEARGIPVLVDQSSYEKEPLGRSEWVRLYGALMNREEQADTVFSQQKAILDKVAADAAGLTDKKTVAFFYITSGGTLNVRKSSDYVPKMIGLAGGKYIFEDLGDDSTASSTVKMQMEEFYAAAKDADYIIYNATIDGEVDSIASLLGKSELLGNLKAVQDGNVWCTSQSMYQESMSLASFISDVHKILIDPSTPDTELDYLYKLK